MIRNEGCFSRTGEKLKIKGKVIILATYIVQAAIYIGYAIYNLTHQTADTYDQFYLAMAITVVVYNLVFLILGIFKGYALHIIAYAIMTIFSSLLYDYIAINIYINRAHYSRLEWRLFFGGIFIMSACTICQLVICPFLYRYHQTQKLMQIGASDKIWSLYWHISMLKSMSLLEELLYLFLAFFSVMFQINWKNKNYIAIIELVLEIVFIVLFTIQSFIVWVMANRDKAAFFIPWGIINLITFIFEVNKLVCAFLGYSIIYTDCSDLSLKSHYIAITILSVLLVIVFTLSLMGGARLRHDFNTIEYRHLQEKLGYVASSTLYEIMNEMSSEIGN